MTVQPSVFDRLRSLLGGSLVSESLIALHLGELQGPSPQRHLLPLSQDAEGWGRYPPLSALTALEDAYRSWLCRRFPGIAPAASRWRTEQTPGSKQALAVSIALAVQRARDRGVERPVVLLPNPAYPTCPVAAQAAGASVLYYETISGGAHSLGDLLQAHDGRVCALVVCSPSNPEGEVISDASLRQAIGWAGQYDVDLIIDECYVDLGLDAEVPGALETLATYTSEPCRWVVLHTLSKRSAAPGLRCGWMVGSDTPVEAYARFNRTCGVSPAAPVALVAAGLWGDDDRVAALRSAMRRNWSMAEHFLGHLPGFRRPSAGFFLWLPVQDDEAAVKHLWKRHRLTAMPGSYLAGTREDGVNPGRGNIRLALVHSEPVMREALVRLAEALPALIKPVHCK